MKQRLLYLAYRLSAGLTYTQKAAGTIYGLVVTVLLLHTKANDPLPQAVNDIVVTVYRVLLSGQCESG